METPRLTSPEIIDIQHEICHLMALAGEEQDPEELASLDAKVEALYQLLGDEAEDKSKDETNGKQGSKNKTDE